MAKKKKLNYDRHNYRLHSEANKAAIRESLERCGAGRSVVIDADDELIAGNGVYEQAEALGIPVRIVETDGTELVAVKRTDLHTGDEKRKLLAFADNATADRVEWNVPELTAGIKADDLAAFHIELPEVAMEDDDEEIERKRKEFRERMEAGELSDDDPEYQEFLAKFEAKKTTDDCYTPEPVYDAVADWVSKKYNLNRKDFVRPFYPGGDFERERYADGAVVVDNPPFSILAKIIDFYMVRGIRFFLFSPALNGISTVARRDGVAMVCAHCGVIYENGASVRTSFMTNMEPGVIARSEPGLHDVVEEAVTREQSKKRKVIPKYSYPVNVVTSAMLGCLSQKGQSFSIYRGQAAFISELDAQKEVGKAIFGGGLLLSEKAAAEKAAAEKAAAEKAAAENAAAENATAFCWRLSDREKGIIQNLDRHEQQDITPQDT